MIEFIKKNALIGCSGYVGTTLQRQADFSDLYRSSNISEIDGQSFDCVVCAAAPAKKWIANRAPEADLQNIERLMSHLKTINCHTFVLISTVDVFNSPIGVDESATADAVAPYGRHRALLEAFVMEHFPRHLIVRLPGLVGPGLQKNVIFDFLNDNNVKSIDSRSIFQFYPMVNLWYDIQLALRANLSLVHFSAMPISVAEVSAQGFGKSFENSLAGAPAEYDMRSQHAALFGCIEGYQYSKRETIQAIRAYAQSESITLEK